MALKELKQIVKAFKKHSKKHKVTFQKQTVRTLNKKSNLSRKHLSKSLLT